MLSQLAGLYAHGRALGALSGGGPRGRRGWADMAVLCSALPGYPENMKPDSLPSSPEPSASPHREILDHAVRYEGQGLSVQGLETLIDRERSRQNAQVGQLLQLRERNTELQQALSHELLRLRELTEQVLPDKKESGVLGALAKVLPGRRRAPLPRASVEQLLREQYTVSAHRVKEAAEFADRLQVSERELFDEIDGMNQRMIESSKNKAKAASFVRGLMEFQEQAAVQLRRLPSDSVEALQLHADIDRSRRLLAEHATQLQLFHTAVDRLGLLKDSTRMLVDTVAALRGDITQYVMAAGEKLDLVSRQLRAIGTAADATATLIEMKRSLEALNESMNQTTRFVAETQRYFRENLDQLVGSLEIYDHETRASLEVNLELSRVADGARVERLVQRALGEGDDPMRSRQHAALRALHAGRDRRGDVT